MNVSDVHRFGHRTWMEALESVPASFIHEAGACGAWTVRDLAAHLASYERLLVDVLRSVDRADAAETATLDRLLSGEPFNDEEVARRSDMEMDLVVAEYEAAFEEAVHRLLEIPAARLREDGVLPWYGEQYDVEDFVVYASYGHKREHSAQVASFLDRTVTPESGTATRTGEQA